MKKAGIRITKKCNFRCKYCNIPNNFKEELSLKEWKKAINILKGKGVEELVILGGEPTLYKDLVELVDYIENELDIRCSLTTNGLNNIEIISKLIDVGISQIGVSIDNLKKENSISPAKVICGLNLIEQLKQKYSFEKLKTKIVNYTVVNNNNINELVDIVKYMNNQNI